MDSPAETYPAEVHVSTNQNRLNKKQRLVNLAELAALFLLMALLIVLLFSFVQENSAVNNYANRLLIRDPPVVLISMDGFRHDYLEIVREKLGADSLPNFARLERTGIRANYSVNVFPTVTFPNHQTLITGLYPESHGIVENAVIDSSAPDHIMSMNDQDSLNNDPWLVGWPEPLWATLQRAGRWSGSLLWPVTDGSFKHDRPFQQVSQYSLLNSGVNDFPYEERVKTVLYWLKSPHFKLDYVMLYFDQPDNYGHGFGPFSDEVANVVKTLDTTLGQLLDGLDASNLSVDLILTSDHGMASIPKENYIDLDDYVNSTLYTATTLGTVGFLYPVAGKLDVVFDSLSNAHPHLKVYHLHEVPAELNFNISNSRTPPLVLVPDAYWYIGKLRSRDLYTHGYPPSMTDMHPFFIAHGPSFRSNERVEVVHAIDVYVLTCGLLNLEPGHPHNGSFDRIGKLLLKPDVFEGIVMRSIFSALVDFLFTYLRIILLFLVVLLLLSSLVLFICAHTNSADGFFGIRRSAGKAKFSRLVEEEGDQIQSVDALAATRIDRNTDDSRQNTFTDSENPII